MSLTVTHSTVATAADDPSAEINKAEWNAGHVVEGGIQSATVTLSSADILALDSTPVTLVAAPGAGKVVVPFRIVTFLKFVSTPYSAAGVDVAVSYNFDGVGLGNACYLGTLTAPADAVSFMYPDVFSSIDVANVENAPFDVFATGAITDGDGTMTITTWYSIEDVP